jgi:hypothetical protein
MGASESENPIAIHDGIGHQHGTFLDGVSFFVSDAQQ